MLMAARGFGTAATQVAGTRGEALPAAGDAGLAGIKLLLSQDALPQSFFIQAQ
jgi:hypothetical protein